jgi:hypothetical protein
MLIAEGLAELSNAVSKNCRDRGIAIVTSGEAACKFMMLWMHYLRAGRLTGVADSLIEGTVSAIHEGIACVALGLARPSLNSLRLQIDLSLAWLYFKDHPVEWQRVQDTGDGFRLKFELMKYFGETSARYNERFGILRSIRKRAIEDPYRLLSAHLHGQNESVLPQVKEPVDIVATPHAQDEVLKLQLECSEYLSDVFWSLFADSWASIPSELKATLEVRFKTSAQRAQFFS